MIAKVYDDLTTQYNQVEFFQDQIVIIDDEKSTWDNAIKKLDGELLGEIQLVNRAIDDVKDAYDVRFTGVNSCRSDLFWMMTGINSSPTPKRVTFKAVAINGNGYTADVEAGGGNVLGAGVTFFHYINPATGFLTTSPTNAITGAEQGVSPYPPYFTHDADTFRFGFAPKNYYGIKYYDEPYARDIGDTFVTSFIGTMSPSSAKLTVMSPIMSTGEDSGNSILQVGQIVSCGKTGVFGSTTKIAGITTGFADLSQIPTTGIGTTNHSPVNVLTLTQNAGLGVSAFDSVSFRVIDDPDSGPAALVGDVTSNGEVYKANQKYHAVPGISTLGGSGATFSVFTNAAGGIATSGISTIIGGVVVDIVGQGGLGYADGEIVTIPGDKIGGTTPADDISFPINTGDQGRFRYQLRMGENMDLWTDPFVPQTVGIMQTANLGIGISVALDSSGEPSGAQSWNSQLLGYEVPMDPNNLKVLTKVEPPTVGSDKSYWRVGFQTAPIFQTNRVSAGDPTGSVDLSQPFGYGGGGLLETLSACDSTVDNPINDSISSLTTIENSFNDEDGKHKLMINASNGLRSERNEICKRIWGMRQSLGQVNDRITNLEGVDAYIKEQTIRNLIQ
jgi:hypothetical protein